MKILLKVRKKCTGRIAEYTAEKSGNNDKNNVTRMHQKQANKAGKLNQTKKSINSCYCKIVVSPECA